MTAVYLGLGSNIGNREEWLRQALDALNTSDLRLLRVSSVYETEPVGLREQDWFLNMAAEFDAELGPELLLQRIRLVESDLGRLRTVVNGPRTIDIDVLLYGNLIFRKVDLEIPHPRFRERRFVLEPLMELNPDLRDPVSGATVADLLNKVDGQIVHRCASKPQI